MVDTPDLRRKYIDEVIETFKKFKQIDAYVGDKYKDIFHCFSILDKLPLSGTSWHMLQNYRNNHLRNIDYLDRPLNKALDQRDYGTDQSPSYLIMFCTDLGPLVVEHTCFDCWMYKHQCLN